MDMPYWTQRRRNDAAQGSYHVEQGLQAGHGGQITTGDIHYNYGSAHSKKPTLQELLSFPEMANREHSIDDVHDGTGRWLLQSQQYCNWVSMQVESPEKPDEERPWKRNLLWIIGNAGAGKSSLLKMAVEDTKNRFGDAVILPHFFNARGTKLEKSTEGMYRTLLSWLLSQLPPNAVKEVESSLGPVVPTTWRIPQLVRLLKTAVKTLGSRQAIVFIDALDEAHEDEIHDMLKVFRDMVRSSPSQRRLRVCFASRPHPHFGFHDAEFLDLKRHREHQVDIMMYIRDELKIGESVTAKRIRQQLQDKAQGIFMWAVLVVRILNKNYNQGNTRELQQRLQEIPPGLHELFRHTMERYPKTDDRQALLLCFQWLLCTNTPMQPETLWWGIQIGLGRSDEHIREEYGKMDVEDMQRWIVSISRGFIHLVSSRVAVKYAQFIHGSVRDFILRDNELKDLYGVRNPEDLMAQSYELLRDCCLLEIIRRRPQLLEMLANHEKGIPHSQKVRILGSMKPGAEVVADFPFANHAILAMLGYANEAQLIGRTQKAFITSLSEQESPYWVVDPSRDRFGALISSMLWCGCGALIRETQLLPALQARKRGKAFGLMDPCFQHCWLYRLVGHDELPDAAQALIDIYLQLDHESRHPRLQQILQQLASRSRGGVYWFRFHEDSMKFPLLDVADQAPLLATFFLIVMADPKSLVLYLHNLELILNDDTMITLPFLEVLDLFISNGLTSDAIDLKDRHCQAILAFVLSSVVEGYIYAGPEVAQRAKHISSKLRASLEPHEIYLTGTSEEDIVDDDDYMSTDDDEELSTEDELAV